MSLVLDPSALILYGEKSEEDKEAIRELGHLLYEICDVTVCLSSRLVKLYKTKVAPLLKRSHPLPPFHVSLLNRLNDLIKISTAVRGRLCKPLQSETGIKFHILETTRIQCFDVKNIGLMKDEDREVLRIALAAAHQKTFLVTRDSHFLVDLNKIQLSKKYPNESENLNIVEPNDPLLIDFLKSYIV